MLGLFMAILMLYECLGFDSLWLWPIPHGFFFCFLYVWFGSWVVFPGWLGLWFTKAFYGLVFLDGDGRVEVLPAMQTVVNFYN